MKPIVDALFASLARAYLVYIRKYGCESLRRAGAHTLWKIHQKHVYRATVPGLHWLTDSFMKVLSNLASLSW